MLRLNVESCCLAIFWELRVSFTPLDGTSVLAIKQEILAGSAGTPDCATVDAMSTEPELSDGFEAYSIVLSTATIVRVVSVCVDD